MDDLPETDSGVCKYDILSIECFGKKYWELNVDQRIEVIDLWNEKNEKASISPAEGGSK